MALQPAAHDVEKRRRTRDVLGAEAATFSELMLSAPLLAGLSAAGFTRPSPIQLKAIPLARCGLDLLVQAKSGTGKTCVFATVALDAIVLENPTVQVLVLAPTREIAVQIHGVVTALGCKMDGLHCHLFIGGTPVSEDQRRLHQCHIAIGSPGRVKQLMDLGFLLAAAVRLFVLDEADKLLEEGSFQDQINWIYSSLPANKQMLALSATYPESMAQQLNNYMREPAHIRLDPTDMQLLGVHQFYRVVNVHALSHLTLAEKVQQLQELLSCIPFNQALIFSNLHSRAQHLANTLAAQGFPAACISGNMTQSQRLEAMERLKHFKCRVLISTDLMARGIDADKVNLVVNLEVPKDWETYLHRVGRAGRFGTYGLAVTFCSQGEEESQLKSISSRCGLQLWPLPDPLSAEVMADVLSTQEVDDVLPCSGAARAIEKAQPSRQSPSAAHRINDATGKKATIGQSTLQTVPRACLPSNTDRCTSLNIQALPLNGKNKSRKVIKASPEKQEELADKEASVWQTEHQKRGLDVKQAEVVEPKQLPNNRYAFVKGGLGKNNENILKRESDKIHLQIPLFSSFKNNLELRSIPFEEFENNYKNFLQDETQALAYSLEDFKQTSQMSESSIDTESSEESSSVMEEELLSADAAGRSESEMLSNISPADVVEVDKTGSDSVCNAHDSHSGDRLESESPESTTVTSDSHWKMRIHSKSFQGKKMASKLHQNLRYVRGRDSFPIWHPSGAHAHWRETAQCDTANDRMCHSRTYFHENWYSAWARASLASSVYLWELQK